MTSSHTLKGGVSEEKMCEHKKQYWNDSGFRMCWDCEKILEFDGNVYVQSKLKEARNSSQA